MLSKQKADDLVKIASEQLKQGLDAKMKRMETVHEIIDLYNNKTMDTGDGMMNIPFPFLASTIDTLFSKIDNPPTLDFKIPNKPSLTDKMKAAWVQEMSSTKASWGRKDRAEKKMALLSGRGVAKVFASSVENNYRSHYEVVDVYSFVADPTRGFLEDGQYHGETSIFKTIPEIERLANVGVYDKAQAKQLLDRRDTMKDGNNEVVKNKFDRLKVLGIDVETSSFAGQEGVNLTEWIMRADGEWFYLLFDPITNIWVRADELKNIFKSGKTPYVSWATNTDEFAFWTKGAADDFYPISEAMRFLLNMALENEKRRTRPMRMVSSGALVDLNELMDYVPDNVILRNPGLDPNLVTVETPEASATVNLVQFLNSLTTDKSGVSGTGVTDKPSDEKVGVFYGRLQQEADRIGVINKEYNESYAHKGYRFFWGLKEHLTDPKKIEMLGKGGLKLAQLDKIDFKDVDDVDDVLVTGGTNEQEETMVENERQLAAIRELTASYGDKMNPTWVIKTVLQKTGVSEDQIQQALDVQGTINQEMTEKADQAIQEVLLDKKPRLVLNADLSFIQRIVDFARENLDYVKLDNKGKETGTDEKMKKQFVMLMDYVKAHEKVIAENMYRKKMGEVAMMGLPPEQTGEMLKGGMTGGSVDVPPMSEQEKMAQVARPNEPPGTPVATAQQSQKISQSMR